MPLPPILVADLFPEVSGCLVALLRSLSADEWHRPTVSSRRKVKDIASHLLDGSLRRLSLQRDGYRAEDVAAYFAADRSDSEAVARCFTENAVVKDEGHFITGRAAIQQWKTDASAKYQYTCQPLACERQDGKVVVISRLTGIFPGSPLNLRYLFQLQGDKIESLEIVP